MHHILCRPFHFTDGKILKNISPVNTGSIPPPRFFGQKHWKPKLSRGYSVVVEQVSDKERIWPHVVSLFIPHITPSNYFFCLFFFFLLRAWSQKYLGRLFHKCIISVWGSGSLRMGQNVRWTLRCESQLLVPAVAYWSGSGSFLYFLSKSWCSQVMVAANTLHGFFKFSSA